MAATLNKKPVTGMKDILPDEMRLRNYVMGVIRETYEAYGFTQIETPCVENLANLNCKAGGDNEKLIFKILKRGEKLTQVLEGGSPATGGEREALPPAENDLADGGLRYDLTVPLVRYYANHAGELPAPFKSLQMGSVFRADRPQRGRYRQFMQCDIDILGEASNLAEIELILATTKAISRLGFRGYEIRINDRRILKAMAAYSGFTENSFDDVFISLDKADKIGEDGVREELTAHGYAADVVEKYLSLYRAVGEAAEPLSYLKETLGQTLSDEVAESFGEIMESVERVKDDSFRLVFDPTLVRGMSYYTGAIFEISMPQFGGSCGGGGRYDEMVEKFTGNAVPACGFSIGFERIVLLLMESGFQIPKEPEKIALLVEKGLPAERLSEVMREAESLREQGVRTLLVRMNKNKKFQKEQLGAQGYTEFREFYKEELKA